MDIAIFLFDGVTALDAVGPYEALQRVATSRIQFVARDAGLKRTGDGFLGLSADLPIDAVTSADILIVPGGNLPGLQATMADPAVLDWIRRIDADSTWTTSVCSGALILGAAGLLADRETSTHWRAAAAVQRFGARYSAERVTIDGKYVTAAGVSAGIDMGLILCGHIAGRDIAEAVELSLQYDPHPPFGTGDARTAATPERMRIVENLLRK